MIYLNQSGYCEIGRGETLEQAIQAARNASFEVNRDEIKTATEPMVDGDVYWTSEPVEGYND